MNIGAFGENFPYSNFHDLNMDWILKTLKEIRQEMIDGTKEIEEAKKEIEEFMESINVRIDSLVEEAIQNALESGEFAELIASVANKNIYFCVYPSMTQQAIQSAINQYSAIKFTPGTYRVYIPQVNDYGYSFPSNRIVFFDDATIVKVGNFNHEYDNVIVINNAENVTLFGNGTINYNREMVQVPSGEHGMCCSVSGSSNIKISGIKFINAYGDGIYLNNNTDVFIDNIFCNNNRRNAISVISGTNNIIENSVFTNSSGTAPEAGIAIETNYSTDLLKNIVFRHCKCSGNVATNDVYITAFSNNAMITLDDIEAEQTPPVYLTGTGGDVRIINSRFKTKATAPIFVLNTGTGNNIVYQNCYIDGTVGATDLIKYEGAYFENVYLLDNIIVNCTFTGRAVLALGSREEVGNIHVKLYTRNISIDNPVMIIQTTRTNPDIEWSIENSDYKLLPTDTPLVFNNYYASSQTRIVPNSPWLKQKIRIVNTGNDVTRIMVRTESPTDSGASIDIPSGWYTEFVWLNDGEYDKAYVIVSDSVAIRNRIQALNFESSITPPPDGNIAPINLFGTYFGQDTTISDLPTSDGHYYQLDMNKKVQFAFRHAIAGADRAYVRHYINDHWYPFTEIALQKNTVQKIADYIVPTNGNISITLPSDGQYILCGWGSAVAMNSIMFIIGGYATASRCTDAAR